MRSQLLHIGYDMKCIQRPYLFSQVRLNSVGRQEHPKKPLFPWDSSASSISLVIGSIQSASDSQGLIYPHGKEK